MDGNQRKSMTRSIVTLVIGLIIVGIIIWAIFFRGRETAKNSENKPQTSTQQQEKSAPKPEGSKSPDAAQSQATNQVHTNQPPELANVGPGNMFGLFAGSTLIGTSVHAIYRRTKNERTT